MKDTSSREPISEEQKALLSNVHACLINHDSGLISGYQPQNAREKTVKMSGIF